jgi:hypothetical protein
MSEQRDEQIKALIEQHMAQSRRESDRAAARQRGRLLQPNGKSPSLLTCRCTSAASV